MAELLRKATMNHVEIARDLNARIQRGYKEWQKVGKIWVEPASVSRSMRRMMMMHRRFAAGDHRFTDSEIKAQEEVARFVYEQHCAIRGIDAKSTKVVAKEFAESIN